MLLILFRHTHALNGPDDEARPLSDKGRACARSLGRFFRDSPELPALPVWHSTLRRARETAELFIEGAGWDTSLLEVEGLAPFDDPELMLAKIANEDSGAGLILVGHDPFMSALAAVLLGGHWKSPPVHFHKGTLASFECSGRTDRLESGEWILRWCFSPKLLPDRS